MAFEQLLHELNRLQRRLYESFREFNTTQDNLRDQDLINFFYQQAIQRKAYYDQIRERIKLLGEMPKNVTSPFADAANEIFTDLKSVFSADDDKIVLQEAVLKEELLLKAYYQVLEVKTMSDKLRSILEEQRDEVDRDLKFLHQELDKHYHH